MFLCFPFASQLFGQPDVDDEDISPDFTDPSLHNHDRSQINDELLPAKNDLINKSDDVLNTDGTAIGNSVKPNQISLREWFHILWSSNENDQSNLENGKISSGAISLSWRLFHHDIVTLVSMRDLWVDRQDRREPSPLEKTTMKDALGKYSGDWYFVFIVELIFLFHSIKFLVSVLIYVNMCVDVIQTVEILTILQ